MASAASRARRCLYWTVGMVDGMIPGAFEATQELLAYRL